MNNKEPAWFISSLCLAFSTIPLLILFFGGTSFIYYSEISNGEKISSLFGFLSSLSIIVSLVLFFIATKNEKIKNLTLNKKNAIAITNTTSAIMSEFIKEFNIILSRESMIDDNKNKISLMAHDDMHIIIIKNNGFEMTTDIFIPQLALLKNCIIELSKINTELFNKAVNISILATEMINSTKFIFSKHSFETPTKKYFEIIKENTNKIKLELSKMKLISDNL